jgi:outer membrane protein TolC
VETGLAALRSIQEQSDAQARAVAAAQRAHRLAGARYKAGLAPLMDVLDAQRVSLSAERQQVQLRGQQLATSVALIKALGGGWEARAEGVFPDAQNRGTDSSYQPRPGG